MRVISEIQIDNQKVNSNIIEIECIKVIYFIFDYNIQYKEKKKRKFMRVISETLIDNQKVNSNIIKIECIKVIYFKFDYNI